MLGPCSTFLESVRVRVSGGILGWIFDLKRVSSELGVALCVLQALCSGLQWSCVVLLVGASGVGRYSSGFMEEFARRLH